MKKLILSSLLLDLKKEHYNTIIPSWVLNKYNKHLFTNLTRSNEIISARNVSKNKFIEESEKCMNLYIRYTEILSKELNRIHSCNFSNRYWETILNPFLYPLISVIVDKYEILLEFYTSHPDALVDIVNPNSRFFSPHTNPSFGSSRIFHLQIFSIIILHFKNFNYEIVDDSFIGYNLLEQGDGKKTAKKINHNFFIKNIKKLSYYFYDLKKYIYLKFSFIFLNTKVIALGKQYLNDNDFNYLMKKINEKYILFFGSGNEVKNLNSFDPVFRNQLKFPYSSSVIEKSIEDSILNFLPTLFLENYSNYKNKVQKYLTKTTPIILNSMNHGSGYFIDFLIAHLVEEKKAKHIMICHGGNYGIMEVSIQERIWCRISDSYILWSNPRNFNSRCEVLKMPSLRFYKWQFASENKSYNRKDILFLTTGHYPQRYLYNSIFPNTIDDSYLEWQMRFLNLLNEENVFSLVIRDFHNFNEIGIGSIQEWALGMNVKIDSSGTLENAMSKSKILVHTTPQTTYLEAICANHPSICYWNPDSNLIRNDLYPYFEALVEAGILHFSPESAASKLNQISNDPFNWWNSVKVQNALVYFRNNVCYTNPSALDDWATFIKKKFLDE
jgi:putative transferase (TIGR04331 family)